VQKEKDGKIPSTRDSDEVRIFYCMTKKTTNCPSLITGMPKMKRMAPDRGNAAGVLSRAGIKVYAGAVSMNIREAYEAFRSGKLPLF
jgi:hypothetical protein